MHVFVQASHKNGRSQNYFGKNPYQPFKHPYNFEALNHLHGPAASLNNYAAANHHGYGPMPTQPPAYNPIYPKYPVAPTYPPSVLPSPPQYNVPPTQYPRVQQPQPYAYPINQSPCSKNLLVGCGPHVQEIPCMSSLPAYPSYGPIPYMNQPQIAYPYASPDPYTLGSPPDEIKSSTEAETTTTTTTTPAPTTTTEPSVADTNTVNNNSNSNSMSSCFHFDRNSKNNAMNTNVASMKFGASTNPSDDNQNPSSSSNGMQSSLPVQPMHLFKSDATVAAALKPEPMKVPSLPTLPTQPAHLYNFDSSNSMNAKKLADEKKNEPTKDDQSQPASESQVGAPHQGYKENSMSHHGLITTPTHLLPHMANHHHYSAYTPQHFSAGSTANNNKPYGSHPSAWV